VSSETEGKARIESFTTEEQAQDAARRLLEAGIAPVLDRDVDPVTTQPRHWVLTLPNDAPRAFEALGVSPPDRIEQAGPILPEGEKARWRIPRDKVGRYIALYVFLVLIVCTAAFFITVWLLGGLDQRGELPEDNPLTTATTR
jgi:hypothetical protein